MTVDVVAIAQVVSPLAIVATWISLYAKARAQEAVQASGLVQVGKEVSALGGKVDNLSEKVQGVTVSLASLTGEVKGVTAIVQNHETRIQHTEGKK